MSLWLFLFGYLPLEQEPQSKLHLTFARVVESRIDYTEARLTEVAVWLLELRCVRQIVGLRPELEPHIFSDLEALEDRKVIVEIARPTQAVPPCGTITRCRSRWNRVRKRCYIEPRGAWPNCAHNRWSRLLHRGLA
jgi:hypothetical protein